MTGRPLIMEQGGALATRGYLQLDSEQGNGKGGVAASPAILEELHDLGAEEVRSRLGTKPGPAVSSIC